MLLTQLLLLLPYLYLLLLLFRTWQVWSAVTAQRGYMSVSRLHTPPTCMQIIRLELGWTA